MAFTSTQTGSYSTSGKIEAWGIYNFGGTTTGTITTTLNTVQFADFTVQGPISAETDAVTPAITSLSSSSINVQSLSNTQQGYWHAIGV